MFDASLTPQQRIVIDGLSAGMTSTDAAAQAGVHRNTIANWRRNSLLFREALADAQCDRALHFRDQAESMLDVAFETLKTLLADPKASPSVRLKAALFLIGQACTPPAPRKFAPIDVNEMPVPSAQPPVHKAPSVHKMHNAAQPEASAAPAEPQTFRRETPKVGRNEACPCGSGQKFKRCCLDKPQSQTRAA